MKNGRRNKRMSPTNNAPLRAEEEMPKPHPNEQPGSVFPVFTVTLTMLQVVCYLLFAGQIISSDHFVFNYSKRYQLWRYFTVALAHDDLLHLIGNFSTQLLYGIYLERRQGWKRTGVVFFSGAVLAELALPFLSKSYAYEGIGCSAGVNALISASLLSAAMNRPLSKYGYAVVGVGIFLLGYSEPLSWYVVLYIKPECKKHWSRHSNIYTTIWCEHFPMLLDGLGLDSVISHAVGTVTGMIVGISILILQPEGLPSKHWKITAQKWSSIFTMTTFTCLAIVNGAGK